MYAEESSRGDGTSVAVSVFQKLTVLSVRLSTSATMSRPISKVVAISKFSSYVSLNEGSGYLSRGVCFLVPLCGPPAV